MKPRYKIDLSQQLAECEANYFRFLKLLPDADGSEDCVFAISDSGRSWQVHLQRIDQARYTDTWEISQDYSYSCYGWDRTLKLTVRLYHDACMAEVIACRGNRCFKARYEYPNPQMYQSNEKAVLNEFLSEWLSYCLDHGHVTHSVVTLGIAG